jgi:hypothetical protein
VVPVTTVASVPAVASVPGVFTVSRGVSATLMSGVLTVCGGTRVRGVVAVVVARTVTRGARAPGTPLGALVQPPGPVTSAAVRPVFTCGHVVLPLILATYPLGVSTGQTPTPSACHYKQYTPMGYSHKG